MNWPNKLSILRLILAPIFYVFFIYCGNIGKLIAFFLLLIIEVTDIIDGMIARRTNQVTDFGKILDPFADKIAKLTYFLAFLHYRYYPVWMFLIILYREFFITIFRQYAERNNVVIAARITGKIKTEFQSVGSIIIVGLIILNIFFKISIDLNKYIYLTMLIITIATLLSIIDYVYSYIFLFKQKDK